MGVTDILSGGVLGAIRDAAMAPGPDVVPATLPAWAVSFREDGAATSLPGSLPTVGSETYDGSVTVTLPRDLSGGSYEIVIEGMTDEDYAAIRLPAGHRSDHRLRQSAGSHQEHQRTSVPRSSDSTTTSGSSWRDSDNCLAEAPRMPDQWQ